MIIYSPTTIITVCSIGSAIGLLLTNLRFYVRLRYAPTRLGLDDLFIVLAAVFTLLFYSLYMYDTVAGAAGNATTAATPAAVVEHMMDYAMEVTEKFAYGSVKLSLLFFFRRIFGIFPRFMTINDVMIGVVGLWTLAFLLQGVLICGDHPERYWAADQRIPEAECGNGGAALLSYAVTGVVTDFMILIVPLIYVHRLLLDAGSKRVTSFIFLLGFISTAAGTLRLVFLCMAYPMGRLSWLASSVSQKATPYVFQVINPAFWGVVELELGVWAANLPPLSPLLRALSPRKTGEKTRTADSVCSGCESSASTPPGTHPSELIQLPIAGGRL